MENDGDQQPLLSSAGRTDTAAGAGEGATVGREPTSFSATTAEDEMAGDSRSKTKDKMQSKASSVAAVPLRYAAPLGGVKGSLLRSLPVVFVLSLLSVVVGVYVSFHIAPLLQQHETDRAAFNRGIWEFAVFVFLLALFMLCFALSVFVRPGQPTELGEEALETHNAAETKSGGGLRVCKWCGVWKPDRTHHCRVCRGCVLRMDHHCPWLANCVGWGNHKYFMLLLFYGALTCLFVAATMLESVIRVVNEPKADFVELFLLLLGSSLDILIFAVIFLFGLFHLYLLAKGMTTIEFCEKRFKRAHDQPPSNMWNLGFWRNFNEVFGYNPLLWFVPVDNRHGDGRHFPLSVPSAHVD
ncbi:zinc finger DHHC domain-containing protein, putative [Eimeria maxima]|uniref:Palmitoyltransferase n=1 Tax=Eimeria maxima TaxID=5804 RepID=U6M4U8_EIMMA|nr:zinc finger DHHC domain-containing protein, putative [Eimeria maxima]CDJ59257.1 zinc finger DHHC domain-containing protein, putative [Eimeria maxima]